MGDVLIRILVIDDEYELHTKLRTDLLPVLADYQAVPEVIITTNITAAFRYFSKSKIHLIALNPENSAQPDDLISDLRFARAMPILIFSREFTTERRAHYLNQGADMVIPKPPEYREYLPAVKNLLKRYYISVCQLDEVQLRSRYKKLMLDPLRNFVEFDGVVHWLTKKEFEVLRLLADHPGKVLTKDYIFLHVWGNDFGDSYKSVTDIISRIRKKLGEGFDEEYVENVYGTGYRFGRAIIDR